MTEKRNQDIIHEIWKEEVSVSKMNDLRETFMQGLGVGIQGVEQRINGRNRTNDFEFLMMIEILERVVNITKWEGYINEKRAKYGRYTLSELR